MRNIFLVIVDCLRADFAHSHYLPFYRGSLVFRNCWATAGATVPCLNSIYTGLLPSAHGGAYPGVYPQAPNVLQMAKARGYNTLSVTENPLTKRYGRHFPVYKQVSAGEWITPGVGMPFIKKALPHPPWFVCYHYMRAHHPYIGHPVDKFGQAIEPRDLNRKLKPCTWEIAQQLREAYERGVIESFWQLWELYQCYDDATFIITADHGEAFWEHGFVTHIADRLVPELLHVPLIVADRWGGEPVQVWHPVSIASVPAIALLAGQGARYVPSPEYVRAEDYQHSLAVAVTRIGNWVGFVQGGGEGVYYDLDNDPGMHYPVEEPPADVLEALRPHMQIHPAASAEEPDDEALVLERLRALGYAD